jgi:hypothetical protein
MKSETSSKEIVSWIVMFEVPDCPGAPFTTISERRATIEAPDDYEEAKKIAISYLNGLKNGAKGRGLWRKE